MGESSGGEDPYSKNEVGSMEDNYLTFDKQKATLILAATLFAMLPLIICTYLQVKNNPEGLWASLCRCLFTMISCIFKVIFLPCRIICCRGSQNSNDYSQHVQTTDFSDFNPDFSRVEMT